MKAILTSTLGGAFKVDGKRVPSIFMKENGLLQTLREEWIDNAKVMIICGSPNDYEKNDSICECLKKSFPMSGLDISYIGKCDGRNEELIEKLREMDVCVLAGGHVPTQNSFMKKINLKKRLVDFSGLLIAWSAGSMNCAANVYAAPELEGEAADPGYKRWISGLGITEVNIFPHYQLLKDEYLDGMSKDDGSYIMIKDGKEILFGEAYWIKDGNREQACKNGESVVLRARAEM